MSLTKKQIEARKGKLTASRIAVLMTGDKQGIYDLWREMIDDPDFTPVDLSDNWAVRLGACTEQVNLDWYERKWGPVTRRGEVVIANNDYLVPGPALRPYPDWMACTLDGWDITRNIPIEAKHVGGFEHLDIIVDRYQPQMQWTTMVTNAPECALSVIIGAQAPIVEFIKADPEYQAVMGERAFRFMACVRDLRAPVDLPPVAPPVIPVKTYSMQGSNAWATFAGEWLEQQDNAASFEHAKKELKKLVPPDAIVCRGHGIEIRRARDGSLRIREPKT